MPLSDEELAARFVALRDQDAFAELVRRYQSPVRGFLRHLTGDPSLADDIAQDTFVRTWRKLHTFSRKGRLTAWIMRLAYREFLQTIRRRDRHGRLLDRLASETLADSASQPRHERADLVRFLGVLSPDERVAIILGYGYGFSHDEIRGITGMPPGPSNLTFAGA
ncbi:MAG: sigma-70 family RNA polymerase sigma factor [Pseudomonadales bacterium]